MLKYIRYKDHITLYTEDNWYTIESVKNESKEGKEETNKDIITEVKLRYMLGDSKAKVIIKELCKIREEFQLQTKDGYGHAFEIFVISVLHNIDYDIAYNNYIIKGKEDGKIDAIYWSNSKIIIYQIKLDFLDLNDLDIMKLNYVEFLKTGKISNSNTFDLLKFCNDHKEKLQQTICTSYKTVSTNNNKDNYQPKEIFEKFFENAIISKENNIRLELFVPMNNGIATLNKKNNVYAYFVSAKEFIENILKCDSIRKKENLYKLFYDNVRGYLGLNESIEETIANDSENFVKYNNGITVTGEVELLSGTGGAFIITNPVINNGQQTLQNLIEKYPHIEGVDLLIILKNEDNSKIKARISRYTNSQKTIKPVDLLSLDENLRKLQSELFRLTNSSTKDNSFFLELNSSGTKSYNKIVKTIYLKTNIIGLTEFCKLYFSTEDKKLGNWKSNVSTMIGELLSNSVEYDLDKALLVCKTISKYKIYVESIEDKNIRNILKVADLAFMYIMYKYKVSEEKAHEIIDKINYRSFFSINESERKSKLIDLYKSNTIVEKIEEIIKEEKIEEESLLIS